MNSSGFATSKLLPNYRDIMIYLENGAVWDPKHGKLVPSHGATEVISATRGRFD
jgi:hypothetical protein